MTLLKQAIKAAILKCKVPKLLQSVARPRVLILRYHSVRENPELLDHCIGKDITHSVAVFRAQMQYVTKTCNPVSLEDLPDISNGSAEAPRRGVVITFDDGYIDNYELAAPTLEQFGLRGVFYIPTSSIEGRPLWFIRLRHWRIRGGKSREQFLAASSRCATLSDAEREEFLAGLENGDGVRETFSMTWAQARELTRRGHTIGSHTVNHPNVAKISPEERKFEMECSRKTLEKHLDCQVRHFSYPNPILQPHWDRATIAICRNASYRTAVTCTEGHVIPGANVFALPRQSVPDSFDEFVWKLEMAFSGS